MIQFSYFLVSVALSFVFYGIGRVVYIKTTMPHSLFKYWEPLVFFTFNFLGWLPTFFVVAFASFSLDISDEIWAATLYPLIISLVATILLGVANFNYSRNIYLSESKLKKLLGKLSPEYRDALLKLLSDKETGVTTDDIDTVFFDIAQNKAKSHFTTMKTNIMTEFKSTDDLSEQTTQPKEQP